MDDDKTDEVKVLASKHWVIDKRIPVVVIIGYITAIAVQTFFAIQWADHMDDRVGTLELAEHENKTSREEVSNLKVKMDAIHDDISAIKNTDLQDIKRSLDHLTFDNRKGSR